MQVYKSECGKYLCRVTRCWGSFEAWTIDGSIHWRDDNRVVTWADHIRVQPAPCGGVGTAAKEGA